MSTPVSAQAKPEIEYPERDGRPMADNTLQFQSIVTIVDCDYSGWPGCAVPRR
jgi:hypothetical protein